MTTNYAPNDYSVVTQGQLKQFTTRAVDYLNSSLTNGAGTDLNSMVSNWSIEYQTNGYSATNIDPADYTAMTVGQLKYVGNKVWLQLVEGGYTNNIPTWLAQNTNGDSVVANLGQLKEVFNFVIPTSGGQQNTVSNFTITTNSDGSLTLGWTLANTGSPVQIEGENADGTWTTLTTASPGATSITLSAAQTQNYFSLAADNSGSAPGTPPTSPGTQSAQNPQTTPAPRYAVIDLGTNYYPTVIATNGMAFAPSYSFESSSAGFRWINGTWQTLSVPGAVSVSVGNNAMNNNGVVVGGASFPVSDGLHLDDRGIIWTASPTNPEIDQSDINIQFANNLYSHKSRLFWWCGDSSTGQDFTFNNVFGDELVQGTIEDSFTSTVALSSITIDPFVITPLDFTYFATDGAYFSTGSASASILGDANWIGNFAYAIGGPSQAIFGSVSYQGKTEYPLFGNSNWLISSENTWDFSNEDQPPGVAKCFPFGASPAVPLSGGTSLPSELQSSNNSMYITHATSANDDVVVGSDNSWNGYYWSVAGGSSAVLLGTNAAPVGVSSRYYQPSATGTNAPPAPVPDYQILADSVSGFPQLFERTRDTNGAPVTPIVYKATPLQSYLPNQDWILSSGNCMSANGSIGASATYNGTNTAVAAGEHSVMLLPAELAVDANRDGTIVMGHEAGNPANTGLPVDTTSQDKPFRFWLNNNEDQPSTWYGVHYLMTVPPVTSKEDYLSDAIVSTGDLEDWTRLWIYTKGLNAAIQTGQIKVGLKWNSTTNTPSIKIIQATDSDGGVEYLSDTSGNAATAQATSGGSPRSVLKDANDSHTNIVPTGGAADFVFPTSTWASLSESTPVTHFLFEATGRGQGQLQIVFLKSDGTLLGAGGDLWLDLRDVQEMYRRVIASGAGPSPNPPEEPYASNNGGFNDAAITTTLDYNNNFVPPFDESQQCLIFVHGWQTDWDGFTDYSSRFFKRLWWQGYKGRFVGFNWAAMSGVWTYNPSEWKAWLYGKSFMNYVNNSIKPHYTDFTVVAHSQGNVVVGAAIQEGLTIPRYILMEAALPTGLYTTSSTYNSYQPFLQAESTTATPDAAANLGYRGYLTPEMNNVAHYYCFYNPSDFALATGTFDWSFGEGGGAYTTISTNWEADQITYKPDGDPGQSGWGSYSINSGVPKYNYQSYSLIRNVTDIHESMSFEARPRSQAAGADVNSPFVFQTAVGLNHFYGFGNTLPDHSGQFTRDYDQVYSLYDNLESIIDPQGD